MSETKDYLFTAGELLLSMFCHDNKIPRPAIYKLVPNDDNKLLNLYYRFMQGRQCAFYHSVSPEKEGIKFPAIFIDVNRCANPGYRGRMWSWPGYAVDRTPYGVLQHELGHHIVRVLRLEPHNVRKNIKEPKMTGYCDNDEEWFVEILRVFITNPQLLRKIRPKMFQYFRKQLKLKITTDDSWLATISKFHNKGGMKETPTRTIIQCEKRVDEAKLWSIQ